MFLGFMQATSGLIDAAGADLWVASHGVPYVELGVPFHERKLLQVREVPGVALAEKLVTRWSQWKRPDGREESVQIIGFEPNGRMGRPWNVVEGGVDELKAPDTVVIDELYKSKLGASVLGETFEIGGRRARAIAREELDRDQAEYEFAEAKYREALEHHAFVDDEAREEDRALGQAELELARARLEEARSLYAKTVIRAPIDGVVLRRHHRAGESVSAYSSVPDPILTVGDTRTLRVRLEIDESEITRVHVGQPAYVTALAFGERRFRGRVWRVGLELGRKRVHTDDPVERADTKILETLVELDGPAELPVGLRVDGYLIADAAEPAGAVARGR